MNFDTLRDHVRARGADVHAAALEAIVAELTSAAGGEITADSFATSSVPGPTRVEGTVAFDNATAVTRWRWERGDPNAPCPQHDLDGVEFDENDWRDVLAAPGEPFGAPYWYPGDHTGCQCSVENVVGELIFDPEALEARPTTVRAFGRTVVVTPPAPGRQGQTPPWWRPTLPPERWSAAVAAASRS